MGFNSSIEWTNATWNPVTGCTKISRGCQNCYAEKLARRLQAMGQYRYSRGFRIELHHDLVDAPLRWPKPRMIFVNSMSDLFHEEVPEEFIFSVFRTMVRAKHHVFQVLTKRSRRLVELAPELPWPEIGTLVGGLDCAAVSQARGRLHKRRTQDEQLRKRFQQIANFLFQLSRSKI